MKNKEKLNTQKWALSPNKKEKIERLKIDDHSKLQHMTVQNIYIVC